MDVCTRRLYLVHATVDTPVSTTQGGIVQMDLLPVIGFTTTGPGAGRPLVMPAAPPHIPVEMQSQVIINGAAPIDLNAYYDRDIDLVYYDGVELGQADFRRALRDLV